MSEQHIDEAEFAPQPGLWLSASGTAWWIPALLILSYVLVPAFVSDYWLGVVLVPMLVLALAGLGLNLLTGYTGQISLGSGGFMAVGAFATFNLATRIPGLPLPLALILGGLIAALAGVLFSLPSARIKGFYLMVSSLTAQFFFEWLFQQVPWFYNNASAGTISLPNMSVLGINFATARGSYYLTLVTVTLGFWLAYNLLRGNTGRVWTAIRDMDTAAAVIGIRVYRYKVLAFGVSSFFLGIAGALWAFAYLGTASVQSFDLDRSFQVLFIIIIGGMGSLAGNFIGSIFILLLPLLLDRISQGVFSGHLGEGFLQNVEKVIFGGLIAFFVIKEPDGIANLIQSLRDRVRVWPLRF